MSGKKRGRKTRRNDSGQGKAGKAANDNDSRVGTSHLKFGPNQWDLGRQFSLDKPGRAMVHFAIFQNGTKPTLPWEMVFHFSMFCAIVMGYSFMDLMVGERLQPRLPEERYQRLRRSLPHVRQVYVDLIIQNNPKNGKDLHDKSDKYFFETLRLVRQSMFDLVEDWLKHRPDKSDTSQLTPSLLAQKFEEKWNHIKKFQSFMWTFRTYWKNKYEDGNPNGGRVDNPWGGSKKRAAKAKKRGIKKRKKPNQDGQGGLDIVTEDAKPAATKPAATRREARQRQASRCSLSEKLGAGSDSGSEILSGCASDSDSYDSDSYDSDSSYNSSSSCNDKTNKRKMGGSTGRMASSGVATKKKRGSSTCDRSADDNSEVGTPATIIGNKPSEKSGVASRVTNGDNCVIFNTTVSKARQREARTKAKILAHSVISDWDGYIPAEQRLKPLSKYLEEANYQLFDTDKYPPQVEMLFERLKPGETGTAGQDWRVDGGLNKLQGYYVLGQSRQGFYSFTQSHKTYHQHISAVKEIVYGKDLEERPLKNSEVDEVNIFAKTHNISFFRHAPTDQHVEDVFLNHCQEGSALFNEVTGGGEVLFDAPGVLKALQAILDKSKKEDNERDEKNKRGTLSIGGGFGNHNFDDDLPPRTTGLTASSPEMIGIGPTATVHHETIYQSIGHVAACCGRFGRKSKCDHIPFYHDPRRQGYFGNKLAYLLGAMDSPFEAWSVAGTRLGWIRKGKKGQWEFIPDLDHKLLRHLDGPNCPKPGYDVTVVYWVIIVDEEGGVWRLVVIFYSRLQCGKTMEREQWTKVVRERMMEWESEMIGGRKLEDLTEKDFQAWERVSKRIKKMGQKEYYQTIPLADPMAYFSLTIWTLNMFQVHYPHMKLRRRLELLYLALRMNSALTFHLVVSRWWPGGENPLKITREGDVDAGIPNFHTLYDLECKKLGWEGGLNSVCPRFTVNGVKDDRGGKGFLGEFPEDEKIIQENVDRLISILDLANNAAEPHERVIAKITGDCGLRCIGPVKALAFYHLCVHTGFLYKEHALQQSLEAVVGEGSALVRWLRDWFPVEFGGDSAKEIAAKATRALKRIGIWLGKPAYVLENLGCKMGRGRYKVEKISSTEKEYWYLLLPSELNNDDIHRKEKQDPDYDRTVNKPNRVRTILRDHPDCFVEGQMLYRREGTLGAEQKKEVKCWWKKLSDPPDKWEVQDMTQCLGYRWEEMEHG